VPNAPHGLFVLEFPGQSLTWVKSTLVNNSVVCGGNIFIKWSDIDKGPSASPRYDWSSVDSEIETWTNAGKSVNLIVWAVSDSSVNDATPSYVLNTSGVHTVSCSYESNVPVYWESTYMGLYQTFISALLAKYGNDSSIGYIRFGLIRGGENNPVCYSQLLSYAGWNDTQFTTNYESYMSTMMAFERSQNPSVALLTGLNHYGSTLEGPDYVASIAAEPKYNFGIGSQGLSLSDINNYDSGKACSSDWCKNFQLYVGQIPLELQLLADSDPTNAPGGEGSIVTLLPFGLQFQTQIFEIFISDFQIGYDPSNSNYNKYGAGYRQAFQNTANVVGGRP
jgi:hypothetical protein